MVCRKVSVASQNLDSVIHQSDTTSSQLIRRNDLRPLRKANDLQLASTRHLHPRRKENPHQISPRPTPFTSFRPFHPFTPFHPISPILPHYAHSAHFFAQTYSCVQTFYTFLPNLCTNRPFIFANSNKMSNFACVFRGDRIKREFL